MLALTHLSNRYAGRELREQAREVFTATEAPRDFDTIEVPFPERGPAELIRWSERRTRGRAQGARRSANEHIAAGSDAEHGPDRKPPDRPRRWYSSPQIL